MHMTAVHVEREYHQVGHVTFEIIVRANDAPTFALRAGLATDAAPRRPLFTGFIEPGMADALRQLADRVADLEAQAE